MRIIYTNLQENDAGVTRRVRQLRVEFSSPSALSRGQGFALETDDAARAERGAKEATWSQTAPDAPPPPAGPPPVPVAEGMAALRTPCIKKFIDCRTISEKGERLSITV